MQLLRTDAILKMVMRGFFVAAAVFCATAFVTQFTVATVHAQDSTVGKALFTGERSFQNGGAPCISCHNVAGVAGGTLGPDLTKVWTDKSFLIDAGWINSEGVPIMGPIFSKKNVTEAEVEDLKAFFAAIEKSGDVAASSGGAKFVGLGLVGSVFMLVVFSIVWSGRFRKKNQGTAHDALWRNYGGKGGR